MSDPSSSGRTDGGDYQVLEYLAAVETRRAAPSFPHPDRITEDLASAEMMQPADDPEALRGQLEENAPGSEGNLAKLEDGFVAGAKEYGRRHHLSYEAWIRAGVDPAVLERAGIRPDPE